MAYKFTIEKLQYLQNLSLERKVMITHTRIIEWYRHFNGRVFISFSGGKDSTVLLDLVRRIYPDVDACFANTGLEYPEIRKFANSFDNVTEVHPRYGKRAKRYGKKYEDTITFKDTIMIYGYPLISKAVSNVITNARSNPSGARAKKIMGNVPPRADGRKSMYDYSKYRPLYHLPIKISDECCTVNKKSPLHTYQSTWKQKPMVATLAEESLMRKQAWLETGCNLFESRNPVSKPMSFWTEQDVLHYIVRRGLDICSVYGDIVFTNENGEEVNARENEFNSDTMLRCTGCARTGCIFCSFGMHLEKGETRFQRLKRTHPKLWEYSLEGGEWVKNDLYTRERIGTDLWNPKEIFVPNKKGLGLYTVFNMINEIYGESFLRFD